MTPDRLPPSCSALLDVVRFSAALVVFYSHITVLISGLPGGGAAGNLAVSVFFVLSGFVIRFVTRSRVGTPQAYFIDRASRIYSVVLPSLILCLLLAGLSFLIDPQRYLAVTGSSYSLFKVPVQLISNLTFTSQLWGYEINPAAGLPFWSISFEVLYYALYGLIFYAVRGRWMWCLLLLLLAGPSMALNAGFWLLGCLVYDLFQRFRSSRWAPLWTTAGLGGLLSVIYLVRRYLAWLIRVTDRPERAAWMTRAGARYLPYWGTMLYQGQLPWLSRASTSYVVSAGVTAAGMLWALIMLSRYLPDLPLGTVKGLRIVADSTFTLYLVHLPLLVFATACIGHPLKNHFAMIAIPVGIVVVCVPLSRLLDRFKLSLRRKILGLAGDGYLRVPPRLAAVDQ